MRQYAGNYGTLEVPLSNINKIRGKGHNIGDNNNLDLHNKEVEIRMSDGSVIEGVARDLVENEGFMLAINGDWENRKFINIDEIEDINASIYPYYSFKHKRNLREQKKPRFEFRFNNKELSDLVGKYVSVNYDGKVIEGKVIDCKFNNQGSNKITVERVSGEIKTIDDYRLRNLDITGSSYSEHQGFKRLRDLEEELFILYEDNYSCDCSDGPENKVIEPDHLLEKYFEAKLRVIEGYKDVDFDEFNYNWIQETVERRNEYPNENGIDNSFYKDVKKARDLNNYYKLKKSFIDNIFEKVSEIDWSTYCKGQKEGEIYALNYIYESGIVTE